MIPLRDVIPSRTTPRVTLLLIAVNALVFAVMAVMADDRHTAVVADSGVQPDRWSWMAVATSLFVHTSVFHVAGNAAALWLFGENVEDRFGHARYLTFYLGVGCLTGLVELWAGSAARVPVMGASGAIAGVLGAYLVTFPRSRVLVIVPTAVPPDLAEVPALAFAAGWFLLQAALGMDPAWGGATILGLFTGATVGAAVTGIVRKPERQRVEWWAP
jgi:membrane associated rhomboid family serine protease